MDKQKSMDHVLTDIITIAGIPAKVKGFKLLREGIKISLQNPKFACRITKEIYPRLAETAESTVGQVERAIRHAIDVGYNNGKMKNLNDFFGIEVYGKYEKPSNGSLIALIADRLKLMGY